MTVHNAVGRDPRILPAGRHGLTRAAVIDSQRGRILVAMAQSVAEKGYPAATVADVLARARVSRATFYELFADKADCYRHVYATATRVLADEIGAAAADEPDAAKALRASLRAYLDQLQQDPTLARAFIVEAPAAPPELRQDRWAAHRGFAGHLQQLAGRRRRPGRCAAAPGARRSGRRRGAAPHRLRSAADRPRTRPHRPPRPAGIRPRGHAPPLGQARVTRPPAAPAGGRLTLRLPRLNLFAADRPFARSAVAAPGPRRALHRRNALDPALREPPTEQRRPPTAPARPGRARPSHGLQSRNHSRNVDA